MKDEGSRWLPLFPLQMVLFPSEQVPLHIFEPRYRALLRRCQEHEEPFGLVLYRDGRPVAVGCEARVERILTSYPDGRADILVRGAKRFRATSYRQHSEGYLEGKVEPLPDSAEAPDPQAAQALLRIFEQFLHVQRGSADATGGAASDPVSIDPARGYTFLVGARCPLNLEERQSLLELGSESEREQFLIQRLVKVIPRLIQHQADQIRVKGNGRVGGQLT
jgi:ATP-dependent Lon protease